jgi:hypothetical protein
MIERIIDVAILKIPASRPLELYEASAIRGYLGRVFPEEPLLHHHSDNNKLLYTYPRVQFKIIERKAHIVGIEEGVSVINNIKSKMDHLKLETNKIEFYAPELTVTTEKFGSTDKEHRYIFVTVWLALNEKNYHKYLDLYQKEDILKRTIIGNILSMCKGLGYVVKDNLKVKLSLEETSAKLKGIPMLGFLGSFAVNFEIPDYWGIGKSVSRGFGTIIRQKAENNAVSD